MINPQKVAIMQPYLFPYLGYFQLIQAVDVFVFYDDVNFIKRGWINRNRILINGEDKLIGVPLIKASQNKLIKDVQIDYGKDYDKILKTLKITYKKAPNYKEVMNLVESVFLKKHISIADLASESILSVLSYLNIDKQTHFSSKSYSNEITDQKADRLINITKAIGAGNYVNPIGGIELYDKSYFQKNGVKLFLLKHDFRPYKQFNASFFGGLSIIDVLMFNSKKDVLEMFKDYKLV